MSDILFTGNLDLNAALENFGAFATTVEERLKAISSIIEASDKKRKTGSQNAEKEAAASAKREAAAKTKEEKLYWQTNAAEAKRQRAERLKEENQANRDSERMTKEHLLYNIANAKANTKAQQQEFTAQTKAQADALKEQQQQWQRLFQALTIGGFALQRFGGFLERDLTQPLVNASKRLYETLTAVNDFEETLRVRGGKSAAEIESIYGVVKRVSDLPNLERSDVLTIFSRLIEVTQGGLTSSELEKIGGGLSKITTSLEAGEKRAFYGQLQDILGGGNVANIEKTLSLVPLLKSKYDQLKLAATISKTGTDDRTLILQALSDLSILPNVDTLATAVKRLRNEVFEFSRRIANLYKEDLKNLVAFILNTVVPVLNKLLTQFENGGQIVHRLALGFGVMLAAIGPILSTLGAFTIAIGGVGYAFEAIRPFFATIGVTSLSGALEPMLAIIARIPSLLNPVYAVIAAIIAVLAKAFNENSGGFRDALTYLASSVLPAIWNLLGNILETATALYNVVGNLYALFDVNGLLTSSIGTIASGLAYILATAIQFTNLLGVIPATLQFIADLLGGNIDLAMARLTLAVLKMIQSIGAVGKLVEVIFGVDLDKAVKNAQTEVDKLDTASHDMNKTAQNDAATTAERQKKLNAQYKENQNTILAINTAIQQQTKDIEENTRKAHENAIAKREAYQAEQAGFQSGLLDISGLDLTSDSGRQQARQQLSDQNLIDATQAAHERQARIQKEMRTVLKDRADKIRALAEKEIDSETKDLYTTLANYYESRIEDSANITPDFLEATVFKNLQNKVAKSSLHGTGLKLFISSITHEKDIVESAYKTQTANIDEITKQDAEYNKKVAALDKQIQAEILRENQVEASYPIQSQIDRLQLKIDRQKQANAAYLTLGKDAINLGAVLKNYQKAQDEILDNIDELAVKQVKLDNIQIKAEADHKAAQQKIEDERVKSRDEVTDAGTKARKQLIESILEDDIQQADRVIRLRQDLMDKLSTELDLNNQLAELGINKAGIAGLSYNDQIDAIVESLIRTPSRILTSMAYNLPTLDNLADDVQKKYADIFRRVILPADVTSDASLKDYIKDGFGTITFLQNLSNSLVALGKDADAAQIQLFINAYQRLLDAVKKGREELGKKVDLGVLDLQQQEKLAEAQQHLNNLAKDRLDLEEQLLQIRADRSEIPDAPTLSKLFAIISGSQKALDEQRMKILLNQKAIAENQLKIDLLRLEVEEKILERKLKEQGASEEEIKQAHDLYDREVEQIKAKGKIQGEIIDEQIKTAKKIGGTIFDILIGKIGDLLSGGKKKKKKAATGTIDKDGNYNVNTDDLPVDADGNDINSPAYDPDTAVVSDTAADKTGKAVDKIIGHTTRLKNGISQVVGAIFDMGAAIVQMNDFSLKSILNALGQELLALGKYATVKALEAAARAIIAAIGGDAASATKYGLAAAGWTAVAVAAGVAGHYLSNVGASAATTSDNSKSAAAGVGNNVTARDIAKQQALSVIFEMDIRTDDGIIIKKNIKAINGNTELTNLVLNSQDGWAFPPTP